jgi:hypothetical protein
MPDDGWVPVANSTARNHKLSWRARGLLLELLSYPDGWETTVDRLVGLGRLAKGHAEGRDAMRMAMNELEQANLVHHYKYRNKQGHWVTFTEVCDVPGVVGRLPEYPASADQASGIQSSANQSSEDQALLETRTSYTDTKTIANTAGNEHSDPLAGARSAGLAASGDMSSAISFERVCKAINATSAADRRAALFALERRVPTIYSRARRDARAQAEQHYGAAAMNTEEGAQQVDRLAYQYAALHYSQASKWPVWFMRRLEHVL